jgi:hypothetical protein
MIAIFPLARLVPLGILSALAVLTALLILGTDAIENIWAWAGLLPLILYLGRCQYRAARMIRAETGREREIVKMHFVVIAADRAARFWGVLFSAVAVTTGIATAGIWAYQLYLCYLAGRWVPLTWQAVVGMFPHNDSAPVQRLAYWLGDTNFGAVVLIAGLLIAAPLAAIGWRSNNKAKFRHNELSNLKKRS